MPRVKAISICEYCGKDFHRWGGSVNAQFCSKRCSCVSRQTKESQSYAGRFGGMHNIKKRGTGKVGYIKEHGRHQHRRVIERFIGRKLLRSEVVHHIDKNKHNNDISNLKILTRAEHFLLHLGKYARTI